jgi:hypothetical protein
MLGHVDPSLDDDLKGFSGGLMRLNDRCSGEKRSIAGDIVGFRAVFTTLESIKSATPAFQARINDLFELNGGQDLPLIHPDEKSFQHHVAMWLSRNSVGAR